MIVRITENEIVDFYETTAPYEFINWTFTTARTVQDLKEVLEEYGYTFSPVVHKWSLNLNFDE